jgi:cytoskeletal protein CcmA (bactofilin family)
MRKILAAIGLVATLAIPGTALGASFANADNVTLAKSDHRTGTYYVYGKTVTIDGDVDGDVVCAGQTVTVNGAVSGDVLCGAQTITVNGPVGGSVRAGGQIVTINGTVGRNVTVGAQNLVLGTGSHVSGEVAVGAQTTELSGPVDHDVLAATTTLQIGGVIGGSLNYMSSETLDLDRSKVKGGITHQTPPRDEAKQNTVAGRLGSLVFWVASSLVIMLAAVLLVPKLVRGITKPMIARPGESVALGLLALFVGPLALLVVAVTVIGLPLSLLAGTLWFIGLMTASLFAGAAVGQLALGRKEADQKQLALAVLAGVPLVLIVSWLPWVGFIVGLGAAAWSMGGMVLALGKAR